MGHWVDFLRLYVVYRQYHSPETLLNNVYGTNKTQIRHKEATPSMPKIQVSVSSCWKIHVSDNAGLFLNRLATPMATNYMTLLLRILVGIVQMIKGQRCCYDISCNIFPLEMLSYNITHGYVFTFSAISLRQRVTSFWMVFKSYNIVSEFGWSSQLAVPRYTPSFRATLLVALTSSLIASICNCLKEYTNKLRGSFLIFILHVVPINLFHIPNSQNK